MTRILVSSLRAAGVAVLVWPCGGAAQPSTERFYRDGDQLAMEIIYTDPVTMTEPLTGNYRFMRSDYGVVVYGCTPENAGYDE